MSISFAALWVAAPHQRAPRASAGWRSLGRSPPSEHHEHQLRCPLGSSAPPASIMSISFAALWVAAPHQRAPRASAGWRSLGRSPPSEYHEHQLRCPLGSSAPPASIMSISFAVLWAARPISEHHEHQLRCPLRSRPHQRASRASAGWRSLGRSPPSEHHEHQLRCPLGSSAPPASIMRISFAALWVAAPH